MTVLVVLSCYLALAVVAALAMAIDKIQAKRAMRRTPEGTLLLLAIPGWPGAKIAQHTIRHKTVKQPFARRLNRLFVVHAALWVGVVLILLD